jgi:hypothetical protein
MNSKGIKPEIIVLDKYEATLNAYLTEAFYKIRDSFFHRA